MFTLPNKTKVLNLPEQVELNKEHIEANETAIKQNTSDISNHNQYITNITNDLTAIHNDINNINSPDGTITTGTLDVEKKATFGSDAEVDGKLIVNSVDDITDKDGNLIVKNESLDEFKTLFWDNIGRRRYQGMTIQASLEEGATQIQDPFASYYTDVSNYLAYAGFYNLNSLVTAPVTLPDFGTLDTAIGMLYNFKNPNIVLGNMNVKSSVRLFNSYLEAVSIMVGSGKKVTLNGVLDYGFTGDLNLESIGAIDLSGVTRMAYCFNYCAKLKHIHCTHFKVSFDISASTQFETSDLVEIISNLDTVTTAQTLAMGSVNLAKLTNDQILVATGKGWTLA